MTACWSGGGDRGAEDEVLQFHGELEVWSLAGHMLASREDHAVAVINWQDVREHCSYNL